MMKLRLIRKFFLSFRYKRAEVGGEEIHFDIQICLGVFRKSETNSWNVLSWWTSITPLWLTGLQSASATFILLLECFK